MTKKDARKDRDDEAWLVISISTRKLRSWRKAIGQPVLNTVAAAMAACVSAWWQARH